MRSARRFCTAANELLAGGEAQALVVAKLDRLSRSLLDFAALMERAEAEGWAVITLDLGVDTSTPAGEMLVSVLASFAQYERRLIGQRTREGLAQKRAQGVQLGRPAASSGSGPWTARELREFHSSPCMWVSRARWKAS